jgi:hypothetical protein
MPRNVTAAVLCALAAISCYSSCGTQSRIETTWENPSYVGKPFSKLGVIAIMKTNNEDKAFEVAVVDELAKVGVDAVPGFSFLPPDTLVGKEKMERLVKDTGAGAVLMFKLIGIDKTRSYIPPTDYVVGGSPYTDWWDDPFWGYYMPYPYGYWGYWYPAFQVIRTPGYWETSTTYQVETVLYRVSDNKLIWMAMSGTYNPKSGFDLGNSLSLLIVKKLEKAGLVPARHETE